MPAAQRKQTALDDLGTLVRQRDELERDIIQAVASALTAGATWTEIGKRWACPERRPSGATGIGWSKSASSASVTPDQG